MERIFLRLLNRLCRPEWKTSIQALEIKELGPQGRATINADTPIKTDDASDPLPRFMRLPKCF